MIPSFENFLYPVLFLLKDGTARERDKLRDLCVNYMNFSEEELQERIQSGKKYKIVDRLQWATYYLSKAGLLSRPGKAVDQITNEGIKLLDTGVKSITRQYLRANYEEFREFEKQTRDAAKERKIEKEQKSKKSTKRKTKQPTEITLLNEKEKEQEMNSKVDKTMNVEEIKRNISSFNEKIQLISQNVEVLKSGLVGELVDIISDFDNDTFRNLLLELIPQMGYSKDIEECILKANMNHDIAFSGFVNMDELGLNRFFVMAHNGIKEEISLIDIQSFIGILSSIGISKGVYITTSRFSHEAMSYHAQGTVRLVLVDGETLANLMIEYNIGVTTKKVFEIKDVDQEYLFTRLTQI